MSTDSTDRIYCWCFTVGFVPYLTADSQRLSECAG